jgi:choline dehydrogenase-like flavoprotein
MVEHAGASLPIVEAKHYPWGPGHQAAMAASMLREHLAALVMQGEDMPQAANRVDLDPSIRDARGLPVARVTYQPHRHEQVASKYYAGILSEVLKVAGADWTMVATSPMLGMGYGGELSPIPSSRHVMGTVRFGDDPSGAVCDPEGRLFAYPNVLVADSSLFPTSAGYGPTLTLIALSLRNAARLAESA